MTLCLVTANSQILLGFKKRGFGAGRWNGFGGKVNANESIMQAAGRELTEECGITGQSFLQKAVLRFRFENNQDEIEAHLFEVTEFTGEPVETEEMRPQWFYKNEIPYDKMWPDDRFWIPYFLDGKKFEGEFFFKDSNHLVDYTIKEV
jgi:8-oxo-dGTP diphosphatase/2-hydroxy-dATP diphosphatase